MLPNHSSGVTPLLFYPVVRKKWKKREIFACLLKHAEGSHFLYTSESQ